MASEFDESDFIDRDFQAQASHASPIASAVSSNRPPSREEIENRVSETQQRLAELKRIQEELERERAVLEEARRRRVELQTGREEMLHHLTRGVALLEEAEFAARREAEQMTKTLADFRSALEKVIAIQEETWTQENWNTELTRALATLENARMEWNAARLKWSILDGDAAGGVASPQTQAQSQGLMQARGFWEWSKVGLALTWPLLVAAAVIAAALVILIVQKN